MLALRRAREEARRWRLGEAGTTRLEAWSAPGRGYRRLRSTWLPRSCQTMAGQPPPPAPFGALPYWNQEDVSLLEDWIAGRAAAGANDNEVVVVVSEEAAEGAADEAPPERTCDNNNNGEEAAGPTVLVDGDFIEIRFEERRAGDAAPDNRHASLQPARTFSPTPGGRPAIDPKRTVDSRGLSPRRRCPAYRDFLVRSHEDGENNNNNNNNDDNGGDRRGEHRELRQSLSSRTTPDCDASRSATAAASAAAPIFRRFGSCRGGGGGGGAQPDDAKGFLSFRMPKKKKKKKNRNEDAAGRRRYVLAGGEGAASGPVWPAVLLTFDRSISPTPSDDGHRVAEEAEGFRQRARR